MLISWQELVYSLKVRPKGVIHIGAHLGEEKHYYESAKMLPVTWVEANPDLVFRMKEFLHPPDHFVVQGLLWSSSGKKMKLNLASNSQSSSILPLAQHKIFYPKIGYVGSVELSTSTVDDLLKNGVKCEMIVLDLQGVELEVLKGITGEHWKGIKWIYTEVYKKELYANCALIEEIDKFLKTKGFRRLFTRWQRNHGWGDAIYTSENYLPILRSLIKLKIKERIKESKFQYWLMKNKIDKVLHG